mmetsp:Transcript_82885/g.221486  ORF Transcript_82885/g.221486 Transcript_82885/m.221486 type:complete len:202 (-) Transcript_82885:504-1109(-)
MSSAVRCCVIADAQQLCRVQHQIHLQFEFSSATLGCSLGCSSCPFDLSDACAAKANAETDPSIISTWLSSAAESTLPEKIEIRHAVHQPVQSQSKQPIPKQRHFMLLEKPMRNLRGVGDHSNKWKNGGTPQRPPLHNAGGTTPPFSQKMRHSNEICSNQNRQRYQQPNHYPSRVNFWPVWAAAGRGWHPAEGADTADDGAT